MAIGAGNRTGTYLHYVLNNPDKVRLVGVVETNPLRREKVAREAGLSDSQCYATFEEFFDKKPEADAVMICTPDNLHFEPCMKALECGYHVMLEKPIAQTLEACRTIAEEAHRRNRIVSVCHVLRYHPYFEKIKELVSSGDLGRVVSISHRANVGLDRGSHSYTRGIWNSEKNTNPVLLSKCCHDVDFLVWLAESHCRKLSSYGTLSVFRADRAPEGAALRCIDCRIEPTCPFSAVDLYKVRHEWIRNFDVPEGETIDDVIDRELREGIYGRCVYHCDNDVADHQVLAMEMENEITVTLDMNLFTHHDNRETHVCLTKGEIFGDERVIEVYHFRTGEKEVYDFSDSESRPFHAGADLKLVEDFVKAVSDPNHRILTGIDESIESHRICYEADRKRKADL